MLLPFDWIDGQFSGGIFGQLFENNSVGSIEPRDFDVRLVRENVRKVEIVSDPVNGQASDTIRTCCIRKFL